MTGMDSSAARTDGGPAFPVPQSGRHNGQSLRDWFAGMAMQGAIASEPVGNDTVTPGGLAAWSYRIADAMLAERESAE